MLPKGLYDALPWLYMAVGALATTILESNLKYLPALLFFAAGGLVLLFRQTKRRTTRPRSHAQSSHPRHH